MVVSAGAERKGSFLMSGVSALHDETVLEICCITIQIYFTELYT